MTLESSFTGENASGVGGHENRVDPKHLRDITETLSTPFKGLSHVVFGAALAAVQTVDLYWGGSLWIGLGVPVIALAALVSSFVYIPKYYAWRFGWVQQKQPPASSMKAVSLALIFVFAIQGAVWLSADLLQLFAPTPVNYLTLVQSVILFCGILIMAFTPRGRSMLVRLTIWGALVAAQGLLAIIPLWVSLGPRQMVLWKALNAGSLGILVMVMGLSDHFAMLRMLPKGAEDKDHD
jgi:hypothetical protein